MHKLPLSFYLRQNVPLIAQELLGKVLVTHFGGSKTSGRIVETEAYAGESDRASHAAKGRTGRTEVMYAQGGRAYVYLCYGIHQLFNVVTAPEGQPHAVLIRAVEPLEGIDTMLQRTGRERLQPSLTSGPGRVGKAMGFSVGQCGLSLLSDALYVADDGYVVKPEEIVAARRIGVDYAGAHAEWLYRFYLRGNAYVSGLAPRKPR